MTLTVDLTPEQEARVQEEAKRCGLSVAEFVLRRLLGDGEPTGAELVKDLKASGVLGAFADRPDSPEWARDLRERAQKSRHGMAG